MFVITSTVLTCIYTYLSYFHSNIHNHISYLNLRPIPLVVIQSGGSCNAFGVANGLLSIPITVASLSTLSASSSVPYDDREKEVLYAGLVAGISTLWISLQVSRN